MVGRCTVWYGGIICGRAVYGGVLCGRVVYCLVERHNVLLCGIMAVYGGVLCGRVVCCLVWLYYMW